jgi:hypothetical protein
VKFQQQLSLIKTQQLLILNYHTQTMEMYDKKGGKINRNLAPVCNFSSLHPALMECSCNTTHQSYLIYGDQKFDLLCLPHVMNALWIKEDA